MTIYTTLVRVSTDKQERSGLGLDAQQRAVADAISADGGGTIIREFRVTESGRKADWQQVHAAITFAKATRSVLVVAKLDRIGRRAARVLTVLDDAARAGVRILIADSRHDSKLSLGVKALVAEEEGDRIAERTTMALTTIKARIVAHGSHVSKAGRVITKLGGPQGASTLRGHERKGQARSAAVRASQAAERVAALAPVLADIRAAGAASLRAIAHELEARHVMAPRGGRWSPSQVRTLLAQTAG